MCDFFRGDRYDDAPRKGLPSAPGSPDPGPGVPNLPDVNGLSVLTPAVKDTPPDATRSFTLTFLFQNNASNINVAVINNVVRGFSHFLSSQFLEGYLDNQNS